MKRTNSIIKSIEDLILKENVVFSDLNSRYREKMLLSINSMLLFDQLGLISLSGDLAFYRGDCFDLHLSNLCEKASDRIKADKKLSENLLKGEASDFYLGLRIGL